MSQIQVQHQPEESLFYVAFPDGQRASLRYRLIDVHADGAHVDFYSTFVPDEYREQGIAAQLVEHGFAWADSQNLSIKTSCWYAAKRMAARREGSSTGD